jgi:phytoene synthase
VSEGTAYADKAIAQGSQSFAAAARLFPPALRRDVTILYAWCRHCDDVVDGQVLGQVTLAETSTPSERLEQLRARTTAMLAGDVVDHPAWAGIKVVLDRYEIPSRYLFDHLDGFAADVEGRRYDTLDDLLGYCYGVAGVVGLMMAQIMGAHRPDTLDRACDLGLAFQLTNIARDIREDEATGRVYLPRQWLAEAGLDPGGLSRPESQAPLADVAARLVEAAEPYYASATAGLADLPWRSAWSIAAARSIYRRIGHKVVAGGPAALAERVRTGKAEKVALLATSLGTATFRRLKRSAPRPPELWSRPAA